MDGSQDGLKWFGEGFDGFPRILPEDCVEYTIYIIDSELNDLEKREKLRSVRNAGINLMQKLTNDFIWQRDSFNLSLERENGENVLQGRTNFGDSVENEWLIVYILRELSNNSPQIWIRIVDSDGQFLLIEAAGVLPKWLNPEIADFRVWLNRGRLLIIPIDEHRVNGGQPRSEPTSLGLKEALDFVKVNQTKLIDSPTIQAEAFYRLQKYPQQVSNSLHHAQVTIPRKLAYVLHDKPSYISPAIEAFYLRDPIAMKPLQNQRENKGIFPPEDMVTVSTKFTKIGYAQLKSQQFEPPISWAAILSTAHDGRSRGFAEMGIKVTCGFEMLLSDPHNQDKKVVREINLLVEDVHAEGDLLPSNAEISKWSKREDDETWLDINLEDFEKELGGKGRSGPSGPKEGFGDRGAQENLQKMVARFEDFLNDDAAGVEGAEYLDDMDHDDDEESTVSDDSDDLSEDKEVSFDESEFTNMVREMMGMPLPMSANLLDPYGSPKLDVSKSEAIDGSLVDEVSDKDLQREMHAIEQELREAGALALNSREIHEMSGPNQKAIDTRLNGAKDSSATIAADHNAEDEVDIDYNLAKNILESLKGQGGASGPSSNLLGLMGLHMPRDEDEEH